MMIFQQIEKVLSGEKIETRRLWKDSYLVGDLDRPFGNPGYGKFYGLWNQKGGKARRTYQSGKSYAVTPKRGQPAWWYGHNWLRKYHWEKDPLRFNPSRMFQRSDGLKEAKTDLAKHGFVQARIQITALYKEQLQDITEAAVIREGVSNIKEYAVLWDSINNKPGIRWSDNPLVCVIRFRRTDELLVILEKSML